MWDKDTWPNNNGNTSVKLLWLFGLMERGHRWPSAGLKSITDMPSHMIRFVASGAAANTRFIYFINSFIYFWSCTVRCVERLVPSLIGAKPQPPHLIPSPEAIRVLKWGWKSQKSPGKNGPTHDWGSRWTGCFCATWFYQHGKQQTVYYYIFYILLFKRYIYQIYLVELVLQDTRQ